MTTVLSEKQPCSQSKMEPELRHSLLWTQIFFCSTVVMLFCSMWMLPVPAIWPGTPLLFSRNSWLRFGWEFLRVRVKLPYSFSPPNKGLKRVDLESVWKSLIPVDYFDGPIRIPDVKLYFLLRDDVLLSDSLTWLPFLNVICVTKDLNLLPPRAGVFYSHLWRKVLLWGGILEKIRFFLRTDTILLGFCCSVVTLKIIEKHADFNDYN